MCVCVCVCVCVHVCVYKAALSVYPALLSGKSYFHYTILYELYSENNFFLSQTNF